jgi:hypothetical protein
VESGEIIENNGGFVFKLPLEQCRHYI